MNRRLQRTRQLGAAMRAELRGQNQTAIKDAGAPGLTAKRMESLRPANRTDTYTLFTQFPGTRLFYSAEEWVRIRLRLETAGPVAVSTREDVSPVLSGKGILLGADEVEFIIPKGQRVFYAAESVNRVRVIIEPIPWLELILRNVELGFDRVVSALAPLRALTARVTGTPQPLPESEKPADPRRAIRPRRRKP